MDNPAPAVPTASSNLTTFLHFLVPPYFLAWGPYLGVWYALASFTGFLCHIILAVTAFIIPFIISLIISEGLNWLLDSEVLPVSTITPVVLALVFLSFFGWWLIVSMWMGGLYRKHADGARGWRAYMFGGG